MHVFLTTLGKNEDATVTYTPTRDNESDASESTNYTQANCQYGGKEGSYITSTMITL